MKRMTSTVKMMIMTLAGIIASLILISWTGIEIVRVLVSNHQFNWWCIWSILLFILGIAISLCLSVFIMVRKDARRYEERLRKFNKIGGGVNHEKADHGFRRKEFLSNQASENHRQADP